MKTVCIGEHYTFDDGDVYGKLIMFIIAKGKYVDEEEYYYDTISLNPFGEVFQKALDISFFESKSIRLSTKKEIEALRGCSPVDVNWMEDKIIELIEKYWVIDSKPKVVFDPFEPLERQYYGAFDSNFNTILFRSEFLAVTKDVSRIEKTLLHELCHWYLFTTGQEWQDKDVRFAEELIRVGAIETVNTHNSEAKMALQIALIKSDF